MTTRLDFIVLESWILSWSASVQRAKLFTNGTTDTQRRVFRNNVISFVRNEILPQYEADVSEEQHMANIQLLSDKGTQMGGELLGSYGYKIGVAQKLLNLQLKYLWCVDLICEPPHCPVDRIMINKTDLKHQISWTDITDIDSYRNVIAALKRAAEPSGLSLARWELEIYNRRFANKLRVVQEQIPDEDYPWKTHGKGHKFRVDFNPQNQSLVFSYPAKPYGKQREPDEFKLDDIERICAYLEQEFRGAEFPLANNVERLGKRIEKPGLGMAIRTIPESVAKAQASSYLGPYLEKVGVFKLVNRYPAMWILSSSPSDTVAAILEYHQSS